VVAPVEEPPAPQNRSVRVSVMMVLRSWRWWVRRLALALGQPVGWRCHTGAGGWAGGGFRPRARRFSASGRAGLGPKMPSEPRGVAQRRRASPPVGLTATGSRPVILGASWRLKVVRGYGSGDTHPPGWVAQALSV